MNIQDIAKLAGVSASTVSKVMNGKDKDISEETKKKVLKIIEKENYIPYSKFREKAVYLSVTQIRRRILNFVWKK